MELKGVKRTVLDNGLTILTHKVPKAKKAVLLVGVKVGSIHEKDVLNGGSHFNEHMLFKSNAHRTAQQITEALELGGADINAWTYFDETVLYIKCLPEALAGAVVVAYEATTNFTYNQEEFERERQVILTEIKRGIENPESYAASHVFYPTLFSGTSLEKTVAGTEKAMGAITPGDLACFKSDYYAPNNMVIMVAGKFDEKKLRQEIKKTFGAMLYTRGIRHPSIVVPPNRRQEKFETRRGLEQAYLYLGYKVPSTLNKDNFKLRFLDGVFSAGLSSRMFQKLRVKHGIGYSVSSFYGSHVGVGLFGTVVSGFDATRFLETRDIILGEFADLKINLLSDKEFDITRNLLVSQYSEGFDSITGLAKGILHTEFNQTPYDFREIAKYLKKVTKQDVVEMARQYLTDEFTLTALVPEGFKIS